MIRVCRYGLVVVSLVLLIGCNTIEHRSEAIAKQPLAPLPQNKIEPKLVWANHPSSGAGKSHARLRLAVTDSLVFTASHKGKIFAFDRKTGAKKWQIATGASITSGPTVIEERVIVGTDGGRVLAYKASNGAPLWKTGVTGSVLAAPQGNRGVIFVHALDGSVAAINAEDGHQLWHYSVHLPSLTLRRGSSPALVDNHVVVGFANGRILALHRMDGQPDWDREVAISKGRSDTQRMVDVSADPVVKDNVIYTVSYQGRVMALAADSGDPIWERDMSSYAGLAVAPHAVYVADASGVLWALDRKSGHVLWKQTSLTGRHLSAPTVVNNNIVVGDDEGNLHWFAQKEGMLMGRSIIDNKGIDATSVLKDNQLYVLGRGGKIAVYEIP